MQFDGGRIRAVAVLSGNLLPKNVKRYNINTIYAYGEIPKGIIVSITGDRKPSETGKKNAYAVAKALCDKGYVVATGGAKGIDRLALSGALDSGKCRVVLVTPFIALGSKVPKNTTVISEFFVEDVSMVSSRDFSAMLAKRNMLLDAISDVIVIVEAKTECDDWIPCDWDMKHHVLYGLKMDVPIAVIKPNDGDPKKIKAYNILIKEGAYSIDDLSDIESIIKLILNKNEKHDVITTP
ncbi:MAG: DNA-processing protein DprA [Thermoproteus sp.]|nr:DNA-processing protein DprA [Thermoproteus sp.]